MWFGTGHKPLCPECRKLHTSENWLRKPIQHSFRSAERSMNLLAINSPPLPSRSTEQSSCQCPFSRAAFSASVSTGGCSEKKSFFLASCDRNALTLRINHQNLLQGYAKICVNGTMRMPARMTDAFAVGTAEQVHHSMKSAGDLPPWCVHLRHAIWMSSNAHWTAKYNTTHRINTRTIT